MATDLPNNATTTATIPIGGRYSGRIDAPGDSDWIAVSLQAGVTYTFNLGPGAANAGVPFDSTLGIYDGSGTLLAFNNDVGETAIFHPGIGGIANPWNTYSFITFTPTTTSTYYLAAGTSDPGHVGDYVLSAFAGDLPGDNSTPAVLEVGGASLTSALDFSGDTDSFAVATLAGEYYTASVTWSGGDYDRFMAPLLEARNFDGFVLNSAPNFGVLTVQLTFQATSPETWLDIASEYPGFDTGQYTIHIEEASPVDAIELVYRPPISASTKVYFADNVNVTNARGESYLAPAWTPEERSAALRAFQQYSDVANITFTVVDDPAEADLVIANRPDGSADGVPLAGRALFTESGNTEIGGITVNTNLIELFLGFPGMIEGDFAPGTAGSNILGHEIGHHLGLSHSFLEGEGTAIIPGNYWPLEYGDFALGQSVYTQQSYRAGFSEKDGFLIWNNSRLTVNESFEFGAAASPMALDIGSVQQIYGANTTTRTGNDTYVLPEVNALGTGYVCIWDNGGADVIAAAAANTGGVTIDLRAASLDYDKLGGGAVSWARDVQGGFTIAHGVVIENATGGAGDDRLVGNEAANRLEGRAGNDEMGGGAGDDRLLGGTGNDRLFGDVLKGKPSGIGFGSGLIVSEAGAVNNDFETAWDITDSFALFEDPDVGNAQTISHVTIEGTGDGSVDVFKITLEKGATLTIDMDRTTGGLDSAVGIYSADLSWLTVLDDGVLSAGAGGSATTADSYGSFTAWDGGTYYILVRDVFVPEVAVGQSYELHVSVAAMTDAVGSGAGNDHLDGGAGDDYLDGGAGNDYLDGGLGVDTASYASASAAVRVSLGESGQQNTRGAGLDRLSGVENLVGSDFDDRLTGNRGANTLDGGMGNDRMAGGGGNDRFTGGMGNDNASGGSGADRFFATANDGNDRYDGGGGRDLLDASAIAGAITVDLVLGRASGAGMGSDTLFGIEDAIGGSGNDVFTASEAANRFTGGGGGDRFVFQSKAAAGILAARDEIADYQTGSDQLDVSGIDANQSMLGNQAFAFAGLIASVSGGLGNLARGAIGFRYFTDASGREHTLVEANTGGSTAADLQIDLIGHHLLTSVDFVL